MTWALAELSQLFAVSYSVRASLKKLKRQDDDASALGEVLQFWVIFGIYMVFEQHFEWTVRWLPGYYYAKASFIVIVAFPKLQITKFVFHKSIVPTIEECYRRFADTSGDLPSLHATIFNAPFFLLCVALPFLGSTKDEDDVSVAPSSPVVIPPPPIADVKPNHAFDQEDEEEKILPSPPPESSPPSSPSPSPSGSRHSSSKSTTMASFPVSFTSPPKALSPTFSRLSGLVQTRIKDSGRRLSSLAALVNHLGSPNSTPRLSSSSTPDKENVLPGASLHRSHYLSGSWSRKVSPSPSDSNSSTGLLHQHHHLPPPPPPSPVSRSPSSTLDRAVTSMRSMFSLDVHSPPVNSSRRRQSFMAMTQPQPMPMPQLRPKSQQHTPPTNSATSAASSPPGKLLTASLPPLEEALRRGNVSNRRGNNSKGR